MFRAIEADVVSPVLNAAAASRLVEDRFGALKSRSVGYGGARCIVFAHKSADLGAELDDLSAEQSDLARALYDSMKAAGDTMSLDEVKTRLLASELTGTPLLRTSRVASIG